MVKPAEKATETTKQKAWIYGDSTQSQGRTHTGSDRLPLLEGCPLIHVYMFIGNSIRRFWPQPAIAMQDFFSDLTYMGLWWSAFLILAAYDGADAMKNHQKIIICKRDAMITELRSCGFVEYNQEIQRGCPDIREK